MGCDMRQPAKEQLKHRRLYKAIAICQLLQQDFPAAFDTGFKNLGQCVSFLIHQPNPTPDSVVVSHRVAVTESITDAKFDARAYDRIAITNRIAIYDRIAVTESITHSSAWLAWPA